MTAPRFKVGDRVQSGEPGSAEHDTGTVRSVAGDRVTVAWDIAGEEYHDRADDLEPFTDAPPYGEGEDDARGGDFGGAAVMALAKAHGDAIAAKMRAASIPAAAAPTTATIPAAIPLRRVLDLLITALDTPYTAMEWLREDADGWAARPVFPDGWAPSDVAWLTEPWDARTDYFAPLVPGGSLVFNVADSAAPGGIRPVPIDLDGITRGLAVMLAKEPRHFADVLAENDDAITADVFVQCCVFGEVVHG